MILYEFSIKPISPGGIIKDGHKVVCMTYRPQISIVGARSLGDEALLFIKELSTRLVDEGYRIMTGGLGSLQKAAHSGAKLSTSSTDGDTIALLPGFDPEPAKGQADIIIPTGLDIGRNILIANGDAVIAIGGGSGTLSEIALAWQMNRPIISVGYGGWSERLAGETIDQRFPDALIHVCITIDEVINTLAFTLNQQNTRHSGIA